MSIAQKKTQNLYWKIYKHRICTGNIPRKRKKSNHCPGSNMLACGGAHRKGREFQCEAGIFLWLMDEVVYEEEMELQQLNLTRIYRKWEAL